LLLHSDHAANIAASLVTAAVCMQNALAAFQLVQLVLNWCNF
jgi:hypothetical protein